MELVKTTEQEYVVKRALLLIARDLQKGLSFCSPTAVKDFCCLSLQGLEHEVFAVMFLTSQHQLLNFEILFTGTLAQTSVYPREVVKKALYHNAGAVVLAHNHPSGVAEPSRADEYLTTTLKTALALVDVRVIDHIVVAGPNAVSLAERGLI